MAAECWTATATLFMNWCRKEITLIRFLWTRWTSVWATTIWAEYASWSTICKRNRFQHFYLRRFCWWLCVSYLLAIVSKIDWINFMLTVKVGEKEKTHHTRQIGFDWWETRQLNFHQISEWNSKYCRMLADKQQQFSLSWLVDNLDVRLT